MDTDRTETKQPDESKEDTREGKQVQVVVSQSKGQKVLNCLTFLLFLATASLAFLAFLQLRIMNKSVEQTKASIKLAQESLTLAKNQAESAELAAKAAQSSAISARKSTTMAEEVYRIGERPWVGIKEHNISPPLPGKQFSINLKIINAGKTPAFDTTINVQSRVFASGKAVVFDYPLPSANEVQSHIMLLPGIPRDYSSTGPITGLTPEEAKSINEGTVIHYVWGIIRYHTATEGKCSTKFCFRYVPCDKSFVFCEEYNDAY